MRFKNPISLLKKPNLAVVTLNKKLIISIAAVLFLIVLAIMITSLTSSTNSAGGHSSGLGTASGSNGNPPSDLSSLPSNYGQSQAINSIMQRNNSMSKQAEAQISALQNAQQTLQQQLASLQQQQSQNQNQNQNQAPSNPMDQQAMTSSIFFAGGAPAPNAEQTATTAAGSATAAKSSASSSTNGSGNNYQQQNMQGQKLDFLTSQPTKSIYNTNTVQYPASQYILQAGSTIPAILQTTLVSNLPGTITALVSQDVYDSISGKYLLIPRGSKLIGEYNSSISYGQYQMQVKFTRLIRPDGSSIILPNQPGTDNMGSTGLSDEVDNHWGKIIGAAALSAVFNIPSIIATNQMQTSTTCPAGSTCTSPLGETAGASALQAAGQSASNVGNQLASNALNIQPTVVINSGYQFSVTVTKDIVLPPYTDSSGP